MGANPIAPTPMDQNTALQYGLQCQVDGIHYCQDGWIHADLTREEFMSQLYHGKDNRLEIIHEGIPGQQQHHQQQKQPPWGSSFSASATYPGYELVSSLQVAVVAPYSHDDYLPIYSYPVTHCQGGYVQYYSWVYYQSCWSIFPMSDNNSNVHVDVDDVCMTI
jgi:hypothetical protein